MGNKVLFCLWFLSFSALASTGKVNECRFDLITHRGLPHSYLELVASDEACEQKVRTILAENPKTYLRGIVHIKESRENKVIELKLEDKQ